jgi:hypothetical protein
MVSEPESLWGSPGLKALALGDLNKRDGADSKILGESHYLE